MVIRRVIAVWGKFDDKSDFVLEPTCSDTCNCEDCKNAFWIKDISEPKKEEPKSKFKEVMERTGRGFRVMGKKFKNIDMGTDEIFGNISGEKENDEFTISTKCEI